MSRSRLSGTLVDLRNIVEITLKGVSVMSLYVPQSYGRDMNDARGWLMLNMLGPLADVELSGLLPGCLTSAL